MTARQVHDLVRAVTRPYPGAIARLGASEFRIFRTDLDVPEIRGVAGRVAWLQGRGPFVVCADRALLVKDYAASAGPLQRLAHGVHLD
jgi:methionyl-tRNA formyltransferase